MKVEGALAEGDGHLALKLLANGTQAFSPAEHASAEGRARFLLNEYSEARRKLEQALRQNSGATNDLYWLGRTYLALGMPALAAARFEEANWNKLETADLHYYWAVALQSSGDLMGKISRQAVPEQSATPLASGVFSASGLVVGPVTMQLGWVVVSPPASAIFQVHRALEIDPNRGDAWFLCGEIWAALNRHEEAVAAFARAAPLLSSEELIRCYKAWAASLLILGDIEGNLEQVKKLVELGEVSQMGELASAYERVARTAAQGGDLKRQIKYLTLAVEAQPTVIGRFVALADALIQAQRMDDAIRYLRTASRLNPTSEERNEIQKRLQLTQGSVLSK